MEISPRLALRLAGLQVYSRLLARSRARRFAPPPELIRGHTGYGFPEAMRRICPGYRMQTAMGP
ncbi:TPA: hypothetical protein SML19_001038 [Klebsiella oxytoca]|nr:hypothetical protein [Klebsiella oxytoca]HEJ8974539.1 hypothetical protein [Klebsiella oxytoca]